MPAPRLTTLLPDQLAPDPIDALHHWLRNPLLRYHYPRKVQASAAEAELASPAERRQLLSRLIAARQQCWHDKPSPQGVPVVTWPYVAKVLHAIEAKAERDLVWEHARHLTPCEWPWLLEYVTAVLSAREEAIAELLDYQH